MTTCSICLLNKGTLILSCPCENTAQYVHKQCLDEWKKEINTNQQQCEICHYSFKRKFGWNEIFTLLKWIGITIIILFYSMFTQNNVQYSNVHLNLFDGIIFAFIILLFVFHTKSKY